MRSYRWLLSVFAVVVVAMASSLAPSEAGAYTGVITSTGCGLDTCHTRVGYADFASWHASHQTELTPCESCHPNNHTSSGPPSAPEATYPLADACSSCHLAMNIAPAHLSAGVSSCITCHPLAGTLSGYVTAEGGAPLLGATVTVDGRAPLLTYAGGQYVGIGIPVGTYDVTFSADGYESRTVTGVVVAAQSITMQDAVLTPLAPPDTVPPTTTSDARASYDRVAVIRLAADDGIAGSGVSETRWSIDSGMWSAGATVTVSSGGPHVVRFYSTDIAGNVETTRQASFVVRTAPSVGAPLVPSITYRGRTYAVRGTLQPRHATGSHPVRIYRWRYESGAWRPYGFVVATASDYYAMSRYTAAMRFASPGRWRLRAYAVPDTLHVSAWSTGFSFTVVR